MKTSLFFPALLLLSMLWSPASALDLLPEDDSVTFTLSAEEWVSTETARVSVGVEAAVSENTAGAMRKDMVKAVNTVVKADWRLTGFNRMQDSTGLERWSASFEARLPEAVLSGLNEQAKKNSKAGMQITVHGIDFSPTLAERQAATAKLRAHIYKLAAENLADLNTALPGRAFRISSIDFMDGPRPMPYARAGGGRAKAMMAAAEPMMDSAIQPESMERSEKLVLSARVTLAAAPK